MKKNPSIFIEVLFAGMILLHYYQAGKEMSWGFILGNIFLFWAIDLFIHWLSIKITLNMPHWVAWVIRKRHERRAKRILMK